MPQGHEMFEQVQEHTPYDISSQGIGEGRLARPPLPLYKSFDSLFDSGSVIKLKKQVPIVQQWAKLSVLVEWVKQLSHQPKVS